MEARGTVSGDSHSTERAGAKRDHAQRRHATDAPPARPAYRSLANARLHLQVAQQIAESIIGGQLQEGEELPSEQELGLQFGVSRTVIRAAIALLQTLGLVDIAHGKRSTIKAESEWNYLDPLVLEICVHVGRLSSLINDIYHTRLALEVAAAEEAAEKASPAILESLRELCETMERALEGPAEAFSPQDYHRGDTAFHRLLADASGNRVLRRTLYNLSLVVSRAAEIHPLRSDEFQQAVRAHRRIYEYVRAGDASGAAQAMREHMLWAWQRWSSFDAHQQTTTYTT